MCTFSSLTVRCLWLILMLEDFLIIISWIACLHFQWELLTMMMWQCRIGSLLFVHNFLSSWHGVHGLLDVIDILVVCLYS